MKLKELYEFDRSDLNLIRQHDDEKTERASTKGFDKEMADKRSDIPQKGDIIQTKGIRFSVVKPTLKGFESVELGGKRRKFTFPHTAKYSKLEKTNLGQNVFSVKAN